MLVRSLRHDRDYDGVLLMKARETMYEILLEIIIESCQGKLPDDIAREFLDRLIAHDDDVVWAGVTRGEEKLRTIIALYRLLPEEV